MEQFKQEVEAAVAVLRKSYTDIDGILKDSNLIHLKNKLLREIDRQITIISIQNGFEYEAKYSEPAAGEPLRKIMGRVIEHKGTPAEKQLLSSKPVQAKVIQQTAQEVEAQEFKEKATELYAKFPTIENEAILDQFDEMIIRGIGKLAGLPVTENHPKKVDVKFLNEIKEAIKKKSELENAVNDGQNDLGPDDDDLDFKDDEFGEDDFGGTSTEHKGTPAENTGVINGSADTNAEVKKQLAGQDNTIKKAVIDGPVNDANQGKATNGGVDGKSSKKTGDKDKTTEGK
jgi:hypothetical protein